MIKSSHRKEPDVPITVAITGAAGRIGTALPAGLAREDFAYGRSTVFRSPMRHPETTRGSLIFEMQPLSEISGFYPWGRITSVTDPPRPDTYYALSKVYIEGWEACTRTRYGLEVHQPPHRRFLAGAPEPAQLAELYTDDGWGELGYDPQDDAEQFAHRWPDADPSAPQGMTFTDPNYVGD
ncbi:MAG: putative NAD-dependent epimerase/dehydratase [Propionibacteriaceae bacterium]|nr:putative NAD-dependent epimerase/dehydratase [Propionibacteriaceae bacterium]